jgi:hypothetical protein
MAARCLEGLLQPENRELEVGHGATSGGRVDS